MTATSPQEPINMKRIIIIILLMLAIGLTKMFAQVKTMDDIFKSELRVYSNVIDVKPTSVIPDVLDAYVSGGEDAMDRVLDNIDPRSYSGLDVYISDHPDNILAEMQEDTDAQFKVNRYASVIVDSNAGYYLVMIFSYASDKP